MCPFSRACARSPTLTVLPVEQLSAEGLHTRNNSAEYFLVEPSENVTSSIWTTQIAHVNGQGGRICSSAEQQQKQQSSSTSHCYTQGGPAAIAAMYACVLHCYIFRSLLTHDRHVNDAHDQRTFSFLCRCRAVTAIALPGWLAAALES